MIGLAHARFAGGCKVAARVLLNDQWKPGRRCGAGDVQIAPGSVSNIAATVVCRDDLLWVAAERIRIERQGVIKNPDTTANDSGIIRSRRPSESGARRQPACMGQGLGLPAHPGVYGNMRIENPMVLSIDGRFKV